MAVPSTPKGSKAPGVPPPPPTKVEIAANVMSLKDEPDFVPAPPTINRRIAMRPPSVGGYGGGVGGGGAR